MIVIINLQNKNVSVPLKSMRLARLLTNSPPKKVILKAMEDL